MDINFKLDRQNKVPVYLQIAVQIIDAINSGELREGSLLPSERKLAAMLGVNRSTVVNTYRELESRGYVSPHVGRGTVITRQAAQENADVFPWQELLSGQGESLINPYNSAIADLLYRRDDFILMDSGISAPELYPKQELADICSNILLNEGETILQHNSSQGLKSLRESLSSFMELRDIHIPPDNVVVINGSQQALDLVSRILLEPGDSVIIEQPSYVGAIDVFRAYGVRMIGIPVDKDGMIVERLEKVLHRERPKMIYTMPTYQNPTGVSMSLPRRRFLLELANKYQIPILEDDPYGLIYYTESHLPALKSMDTSGIVIYTGTTSKVLCPGLRLGWMAAPSELVRLVSAAKQLVDLHANNLLQRSLDLFIRRGLLQQHLVTIRAKYQTKRDAMLSALEQYAPDAMSWVKPEGGYYVWATLPNTVSAVTLLKEAINNKISFVSGPSFYSTKEGQNKIRLNFTFAQPEQISQGIKTLCTLVEYLQARSYPTRRAGSQEFIPIV